MRVLRICAILVCAAATFSLVASCNIINLIANPNAGKLVPDIPAPASYDEADLLPTQSDIIDIALQPLKTFEPTVTGFVKSDGTQETGVSARPILVQDGTLVSNPGVDIPTSTSWWNWGLFPDTTGATTVAAKTLTKKPYILLQRYWQRVGPVRTYPAGTDTSVSETYTTGYSSTSGSEFSVSVGVSASADFGVGSVTASVDVTSTSTYSETYDTEHSVTQTFEVPASDNDVVFAVWVLVDRLSIVDENKQAFSDPNYTFDANSPSGQADSQNRKYIDIPWGEPHGKTYPF